MILSLTRDRLLDLKVPAMFLYNDYKNAFQDISQAGLEAGLHNVPNLPHKAIAIFRLVHSLAQGVIRLRAAATAVLSDKFDVSRGGMAGTINMPAQFVCAVH
jgi:hypothetical protein